MTKVICAPAQFHAWNFRKIVDLIILIRLKPQSYHYNFPLRGTKMAGNLELVTCRPLVLISIKYRRGK
jgi:hypothetical protein